ncbi:MAG: TIGR03862 family flavoprotein [Burkholderiales bacterium]|nr:TIGR03862 family flavoprotein [Burkholderiales bacterium]
MANRKNRAVVIGGGPAGLMAAEVLTAQGAAVDVYDAMPSVGRKFLLAGVGGMNITHSEPLAPFLSRYRERAHHIAPLLEDFSPEALCNWIHGLGIDTFVGTSGRVFPTDMKAAPLLRAWLHRLRSNGVNIHVRHRWLGWTDEGALRLLSPEGEHTVHADVTVLALGGASWPRLGSDGSWVPTLAAAGIEIAPLAPANCGFEVAWSDWFRSHYAGQPLKSVVLHFTDAAGHNHSRQGECMVTEQGIEGSLIYAFAAPIRDALAAGKSLTLYLDLAPGRDYTRVLQEVTHPRGARSMSSHLQSKVGITGVKAGLLRECISKETFNDLPQLAAAIKALPITVTAPRPIDEAISTAGGVRFESLDPMLMAQARPGVFLAGEMLDWEAPTGGYLLTACFASGRRAGEGAAAWLRSQD